MAKFQPGEVAIFIGGGPRNGSEVVIVAYHPKAKMREEPESAARGLYEIEIPGVAKTSRNGNPWGARPEHLMKKPPHRGDLDELTTWDKVGWKPKALA